MSDEIDVNTATELPQQAIDAGWRYARGDNADDLDRNEAEVVKDYELAYENVDSGLMIIGRGHSNDEAYRDALNQMGIEAS